MSICASVFMHKYRYSLYRAIALFNIVQVYLHKSTVNRLTTLVPLKRGRNGSRHDRYYLSSRTHCLSNTVSIPAMYCM